MHTLFASARDAPPDEALVEAALPSPMVAGAVEAAPAAVDAVRRILSLSP